MREQRHRCGNRLLDQLSETEYGRILPTLERRRVEPNRVVQQAAGPIRHVYFVTQGLFSEVQVLRDGVADVGLIGREGMLGLIAWFGALRVSAQWRSHTKSEVLRMPVKPFHAASRPGRDLHRVLRTYAVEMFAEAARLAACNGLHGTEQRLARWLLTAADRIGRPVICVSHRTVSQMLGVRRAGVSEQLGELARQRIIRLGRSTLRILDRSRLEKLSCECYGAIRRPLGISP